MLRFLYVVLSKRSFDSSTDQGERASVEHPFAARHLQNTIGLGNEKWWERNNKRFILFVSFETWRRATTHSGELGRYCFCARLTGILSDTTRRCFSIYRNMYLDKYLQEITNIWRTSHLHPPIIRNTMDDTQDLCNSRQAFVLRQPIQSVECILYLPFPVPQQLLHEFLCDTLSISNAYLTPTY